MAPTEDPPINPNADEPLPQGAQNSLKEMGFAEPAPVDTGPTYKVIGDTKVPVSKYHGKVWKGRRDAAAKVLEDRISAWDECIAYYNYDQSDHRQQTDGSTSGTRAARQRMNNINSETENVVFANVASIIPALYAKNPTVTITASADDNAEGAEQVEKLVQALFTRKIEPGVNLKIKAKKGIVTALLTNEAWMCVDWTMKKDSSDQAMTDLNAMAKSLEEAKTTKEIETIEGQLMALDDKVSMLSPSGPRVTLKRPSEVLTDPTSRDDDHMDGNWLMYYEMLPWTLIQAIYGEKDENGDYKSVYEPTHILSTTTTRGVDDQINNFTLFASSDRQNNEWQKFGFDDKGAFDAAKYCKVWYIWDKTTRRVYMYHDKYWDWPLWVWDDPYHLQGFFNMYRLHFHTSPDRNRSKGEVSYYLDQQDAINEINDEEARARLWVRRNIIFDKNVITDQQIVDKILKGDDSTAVGIAIPEGKKISDLIGSVLPPSMNFKELFNADKKFQAVDRISSVSDIQRGAQFKTNTTNQAIDTYNSVANMRIDERIDSIEDWIGQIGWAVAQLCMQFMTEEQVAALIGAKDAAGWQQHDAASIAGEFNVQVVGGSSAKPTSENKRKEALQVGQVLGQFANAAPGAVLKATLSLFEKAFNGMEIDWESIDQEVSMVLTRGASQPQPGASGQPQPGQTQPGAGGGGQVPPEVVAAVQKLPQPLQAAFAQSVKEGVPPQQALELITKHAQGNS